MRYVWTILAVLLSLRLLYYFQSGYRLPYRTGETVNFNARLMSEPQLVGNHWQWVLGPLRLMSVSKPIVKPGQIVRVGGVANCLKGQIPGPSCDLVIYNPEIYSIRPDLLSSWFSSASEVRHLFSRIYGRYLTKPEFNLLMGVVLGSTGLDSQFKKELVNTGLSHVVAASGMNVTLVSGGAWILLRSLRLRKIHLVGISIFIIVFYSTITGFEPPIVRAGLMAALGFAGTLLGRGSSLIPGLAWAGYFMLWADPSLVTDYSFLLSFSSMIGQGIVINRNWQLPMLPKLISDSFSQNFAAVLATLPIVLIGFGSFSLVSLFTNVLVLWTVEPLMLLGVVLGLVGNFFTDLGQIVALPTKVLLDYFLWVVETFNKLGWLFKIEKPSWLFAVGYYLLLGTGLYFWKSRGLTKQTNLLEST